MTATENKTAPDLSSPSESDIVSTLLQIGREPRSKYDVYRQGFRAIVAHFHAGYGTLEVDSKSGTIRERTNQLNLETGAFQKTCEGIALNSRYRNQPCARIFESTRDRKRLAALAVPIRKLTGGPEGAVLVVIECQGREEIGARLNELQALVCLLATKEVTHPPRPQTAATRVSEPSNIARAAKYESLHEFAFAMANSLKGKLGCDQVAVGLIRRHRAKILCMSGFDTTNAKSPGVKLVMQAMEECADAGSIVCYQHDEEWANQTLSTAHRLHRAWHDESGNCPVASVPLESNGVCHAVVSLRNPSNRPFRKEQVDKVRELLEPLGPAFTLLERANFSLVAHANLVARRALSNACKPESRARSLLSIAVVAFCFWVMFGQQNYVVSVPCTVKAKEVRQFAAPFEGIIESVMVAPGDQVTEGQLLFRFDTDAIVAQRDAALAELELAEIEMTQASTEKNFAAAAQANARRRIAQSRLRTAEYRLAQAEIRAPCEGIILNGDLRTRVGETVRQGEPLVQFAPPQTPFVELSVPEYLVTYLRPGQSGSFSTLARPDELGYCQIDRVAPASEVNAGKNVFPTAANTEGSPRWLKTGMEGVARIDTGPRRVWWVWFHRVIDSVRLALWKL